jgi:hypothetical protein
LVQAFKTLGKALAIVRSEQRIGDEILLWSIGVVLMVHAVNWLDITYFDQLSVIWFFQLSLIPTLSEGTILAKGHLVTNGTPETRLYRGRRQPHTLPVPVTRINRDGFA